MNEPGDFVTRLHVVLGIRNRDSRERAISRIADELDPTQLKDALDSVAKLRLPYRDELISQLFVRWGALEPEVAMEYAGGLSRASEYRKAVIAIISGWMEVSPDSAVQWVSALPEGILKNSAWETVLLAVAVEDPQGTLEQLQQLNLPWRSGDEVVHAIFDRWAARDPFSAAHIAAQMGNAGLRTTALQIAVREWAESDLPAALAWAESLSNSVEENTEDPFLTVPGADRTNTLRSLLGVWLARDADAALGWLNQMPNGLGKVSLLSSANMLNGEGKQDPELALRIARLLPEGERQSRALDAFFERWAEFDPGAEFAWLRQQTDVEMPRLVLPSVLANLQGTELLGALEAAQDMKGIDQETLAAAMGMQNCSDPATMAAWALQRPDHGELLNSLLASWAAKDASKAADWSRTLPSASKDATLGVIVNAALKGQPKSFEPIAEWATEIGDQQKRQSALASLAESWLEKSPESGRAWLANAPLPQDMKDGLLNPATAAKR